MYVVAVDEQDSRQSARRYLFPPVANRRLNDGDSAVSDVEAGDKALTSRTGWSALRTPTGIVRKEERLPPVANAKQE